MSDTPDWRARHERITQMGRAGDYGVFARYLEPGALALLDGWQLPPGSRLLDVACGTGQIAIPAARAGVEVTGLDIASPVRAAIMPSSWRAHGMGVARAMRTTAAATPLTDNGHPVSCPGPPICRW